MFDMQEREPFRQAGGPAIPLKETADAISFPQLPLFHHLHHHLFKVSLQTICFHPTTKL